MNEIPLIQELIKGGTNAGLLIAVCWFFFSRFFKIFDELRAELREERTTHKAEIDALMVNFEKLADGVLITHSEVKELRRDIRGSGFSDDIPSNKTPHPFIDRKKRDE